MEKPTGGAQLLRALSEYKRLDRKRSQLSSAEKKRLTELSEALESFLDKDSVGKKPKRDELRVSCSRQIQVKTSRDLKKFYIENISGGGLYVSTTSFLKVGSPIELEVMVEDKKLYQKFSGIVAWVNTKDIQGLPPGMGIKFTSLTQEQDRFLRDVIHLQLEKELGDKKP